MHRASADSVARPVRRAFLAARGLVAVESLFVAVAGAALVLASALASGAELDAGALCASGLGGLAAGVVWWFSNRVDEALLVRDLDRGGSHGGALQTAWEVEQAPAPGPLGAALVERVAQRLSVPRLVRAAAPLRVFAPAAPFLACALLVLALEAHGGAQRSDVERAAGLSSGTARHLARARDLAVGAAGEGELDPPLAEELIRLAGAADELARRMEAGEQATEDLAAELAGLDAEIERLAVELAASGSDPGSEQAAELARELADARSWGDAARGALEPERASGAGPKTGAEPAGAEPAGAEPAGAEGEGEGEGDGAQAADGAAGGGAGADTDPEPGGGDGAPTLAPPAMDGTMSGRDPSLDGLQAAPSAAPALRSWPREYDALVEAWLRARRSRPPGPPGPTDR